MSNERHFAVIGRSEGQPTLYHMNQSPANAERLRQRREAATGQPCYVVPLAEWLEDALGALQRIEAASGTR
ncbi:MAG: hypothetical protein M3Y58_01385 [Chloroflexota bacterium]|nr:hypothetical protein [Chloroflexota bacterium]